MNKQFLYKLDKLYPISFQKLAAWTLRNNFRLDDTPVEKLKYTFHESMMEDKFAFYWENGNGRDLDILRLFDFFEYFNVKVIADDYKKRQFEELFKKMEISLKNAYKDKM